jgi:hypothetical protein
MTNLYSKHTVRHSTSLARYLENIQDRDGHAVDKETSGSHSTRSIMHDDGAHQSLENELQVELRFSSRIGSGSL